MEIIRPFKDVCLWEFHGLDIPEINFSKFAGPSANNAGRLLYKNTKIRSSIEYTTVIPQLEKIIKEISNTENSNDLREGLNPRTSDDMLLYFINVWEYKEQNFEFLRDLNGYEMEWHMDNRHVKFNMIANLKDNVSSTEFKIMEQLTPHNVNDFKPRCIDYRAPTKRGSGILFFPTNRTWHRVIVKDEEERHVVMMGSLMS